METGCVFDNHRGIYMGDAIIGLAKEYGMVVEDNEGVAGDNYFELWDEAEQYLNDNVAEEGYCFGFGESGDFMYMPIS